MRERAHSLRAKKSVLDLMRISNFYKLEKKRYPEACLIKVKNT